ncbi:MAG TPA: L28 family ribosomal protein [Candidatus Woesebacteria bacterium]|nr:L28 family ribosomal protein [Candidatus Woesebacteria bacterium]
MECYHCGKTTLYGRSHTHHRGVAGGRWKKRAQKTQRIFKPNLQAVVIVSNGAESRVKLCMKCLKRIKKDVNEGKRPFLTLAHMPKVESTAPAVAN